MKKAKASKKPKAAKLPKQMRGRCITVWWEDAPPEMMLVLGEEQLPKSYRWRNFYCVSLEDKNPKQLPGQLEFQVEVASDQIIHVGDPMLKTIRNLYQSFIDHPND
jgi:hypothetical protein